MGVTKAEFVRQLPAERDYHAELDQAEIEMEEMEINFEKAEAVSTDGGDDSEDKPVLEAAASKPEELKHETIQASLKVFENSSFDMKVQFYDGAVHVIEPMGQ